MKTLHYVMITKHLTGDSEVLFFNSSAKARDYFIAVTNPLLKVCLDEQLVEDKVYYPTLDAKGNVKMWRFNGGENNALDELIGGINHCYQIGSAKVNDDVTHYVADFSEYVDESTISFWNEQPTNTIRCGDIKFTEVLKIVGCIETVDNWGRQERYNAKETYELLNNPENWSDDQRFYCEGNGCYFIDDLIGKVIKCNKKVFKVPNDII